MTAAVSDELMRAKLEGYNLAVRQLRGREAIEREDADRKRGLAVNPDHQHSHLRLDAVGEVRHSHLTRSDRHGHPRRGLGLRSVTDWSWRRIPGALLYVGTVGVYVGLALMALVGWWGFVEKLP